MSANFGGAPLSVIALIITLLLSYFFLGLDGSLAPFVWLGLAWFVFIVFHIWRANSNALKIILINAAAVIVTITSFETYLWLTKKMPDTRFEGVYENYYQIKHPVLGYAPHKSIVRESARKYKGDQLIYDVQYTINKNGLRKSSDRTYTEGNNCLIMFGGSFTFGEGLNDNETMAYHASTLLGSTYNVYNFGLHGYGPHQMLSALEHRLVDEITMCKKDSYIIYHSLATHIRRSAGLSSWDHYGPRYELDSNGTAVFKGYFNNGFNSSRIAKKLRKSHIFANMFGVNRALTEKDVELYLAIVKKAKSLAMKRLQNSTFHIIYWGIGTDRDKELQAAFSNNEINNYQVSNILPGYSENMDRYKIKYDGHPNALANREIAQFVAGRIISGNWSNISRIP